MAFVRSANISGFRAGMVPVGQRSCSLKIAADGIVRRTHLGELRILSARINGGNDMKKFLILFIAGIVTCAMVGCSAPAEGDTTKAADATKDAGMKAADATKDAGMKAADATKDAGVKAADAVKDAGAKAADSVKKAGDKAADEVKAAAPKMDEKKGP